MLCSICYYQMMPGSTVLIADVAEVADEVLDKEITRLGGTITRRPAAEVEQEIEAADTAKRAADKEARRVLREQHQAERQAALSQKMAELRQAHQKRVAEIKAKLHQQ